MATDQDKEEFRTTGDKVKSAVRNDDLFEAMNIYLNALRSAVARKNQWLKDSYLSLVWSVHVLLENQYASHERKTHQSTDA